MSSARTRNHNYIKTMLTAVVYLCVCQVLVLQTGALCGPSAKPKGEVIVCVMSRILPRETVSFVYGAQVRDEGLHLQEESTPSATHSAHPLDALQALGRLPNWGEYEQARGPLKLGLLRPRKLCYRQEP